ncbi:ribbon-helix-helix domain-containing protein [Oryzomicrobium sp.]|uniref:ribbon-helix-helix domain-containing protein n=1 Tax=Oryzomicrobium sp. TaxID=1911578 RepID=UPI0025FFD3BA|nr:ribbon-helix-helix domain-containing protein [Oryzomicrobium sp.]MCE1242037.1 ribbon-helix-helix domain-containing protein [Oryzomicrobium sp.]
MCQVYVRADPILYESRSRSLRIHGVVTTLRLENLFWDTLAEMAAAEGVTTNQLIATLHDEVTAYRGEVDNFASFLRVTCMRYRQLQGESAASGRQAAPAGDGSAPAPLMLVGGVG